MRICFKKSDCFTDITIRTSKCSQYRLMLVLNKKKMGFYDSNLDNPEYLIEVYLYLIDIECGSERISVNAIFPYTCVLWVLKGTVS